MDKEDLLKIRKKIKSKKPKFVGQSTHKKTRVTKKWRRAKGQDSKLGHNLRGYKRGLSHGYGSPKDVKGLHPSGLKLKKINTLSDLTKINPKQEAGIISSSVGLKKRIKIAKQAKEKSVTIINIKDIEEFLKQAEEKFKIKKQEHEKKIERRNKKAEKKKPAKKEKLAEKISEEEKKEQEKKEKDKLLTKKEVKNKI